MKDKFDKGQQKITMPDDGTAETTMGFPEPVSRAYAFDDDFFKINDDDDSGAAAQPDSAQPDLEEEAKPEEETELAYDLGKFGAATHSAAVYRPKKKTPPEAPAAAGEPAQEPAQSDPLSALYDSIHEGLSQTASVDSGIPQKNRQKQDAPQPAKTKNTFTYDEFRARFTPPEEETGDDAQPAEEDGAAAERLPQPEEEPEETLVSASAMNILLDTDDEEEHESVERRSLSDEEEAEFDAFALRETAKEQPAEYYDEGETPPELVAPYSPPKGNFFTRNLIPVRGDSAGEIIRKIIMIIALLAVAGSAGYLINDYVITPYRTANQIDQLSELIDEENTNLIEYDALKEEYPGVDFPEGMMEKYASLYARNKDFVGWLSIDALDISLPVVQGENNEQYLKTDFDGKKNKYGSLFVNSYNDMKQLDMNTTIFGHNMKDSKMLGNLVYYRTPKGYQKAPVIEFNTLYHNYKWKVFAVILTNGEKEGDRGYLFNYMFANLSSEEVLEEYLGEIKQRSLYYPEVDIALTDKFLTISTCVYDFDEARLIILARMVRPGESTAVSGRVYGNENPRYPQAYYDKLKLNNPYADAERWQPS